MIDTDKYEGHLAHLEYKLWTFTDFMDINATHEERCATDALLNDAPLLLAEVIRLCEIIGNREWTIKLCDEEFKRLRDGIRSILSDYDITELIRDVPKDEWNFEQQALVRIKEMI